MKDKKRIAIIIPSRANALICHDAFLCVLDLTAPLLCPDACGDGGGGESPLGNSCLLCSYRLIPGVALKVKGS